MNKPAYPGKCTKLYTRVYIKVSWYLLINCNQIKQRNCVTTNSKLTFNSKMNQKWRNSVKYGKTLDTKQENINEYLNQRTL